MRGTRVVSRECARARERERVFSFAMKINACKRRKRMDTHAHTHTHTCMHAHAMFAVFPRLCKMQNQTRTSGEIGLVGGGGGEGGEVKGNYVSERREGIVEIPNDRIARFQYGQRRRFSSGRRIRAAGDAARARARARRDSYGIRRANLLARSDIPRYSAALLARTPRGARIMQPRYEACIACVRARVRLL